MTWVSYYCRRIHLAGDTRRAQGRPEEIPGPQRLELRGIRQEQDVRNSDRAASLRLRDGKLSNTVRPIFGVHSQGEMGNFRPTTLGRRPVCRLQYTEVSVFSVLKFSPRVHQPCFKCNIVSK